MRKLPVYLLLDTSGSMKGEPVEAMSNGIQTLISSLRQDPYALENVQICLISFDREARLLQPLTPLEQWVLPPIQTPDSGPTHLGAALELVIERIQKEVIPHSPHHKGDWKPLIFVLTDGSPSDLQVYHAGAAKLKQMALGGIVACAAGPKAKTEPLKVLTDHVFRLDTMDLHAFQQFFKWVSASVAADNRSVGMVTHSDLPLPPPPDEIQVVV